LALGVSALTKQYRQRLPELEHTSNAIELLIRRYRDTTGNDIVRSYDIGVEEESSFLEKAMMQGVSVQNVWDKVDVLGFRIVCLFSGDIVRIENEFVKEHFKNSRCEEIRVDRTRRKIEDTSRSSKGG